MASQGQWPKQKLWMHFLERRGTVIFKMLALDVPEEELVTRLLERGKESGRADDRNEEIIRNRIKVYEQQTSILAQFYQAKGSSWLWMV